MCAMLKWYFVLTNNEGACEPVHPMVAVGGGGGGAPGE